ncbi:MAG TPA: DUF998 domain-containing protein [Euryarchaeota archaeon]|jgi:hypothetical membrane protein|nr:DUF998 domain-containing protein [Euryarchaeota archaeon]
MLAETMAPGYSMNDDTISDLGIMPGSATLFNGVVMLTGMLVVAGGLLFHRHHGRNVITALFILSGVGTFGVGVFTVNTPEMHTIFAVMAFLSSNVLAIASHAILRGPLKALSVVLGANGLVFLIIMGMAYAGMELLFGPIGYGGTERMIVFPVMVWLLGLGGYLMGPQGNDARREGREHHA